MRNIDLFDSYLDGELIGEEKQNFETRLQTDEVFSTAFYEHKNLIESLSLHASRNNLKSKLNAIHKEAFGNDARILSVNKEETFAKRAGRTVMVAASTAIIAVLSTVAVLSAGGYLLKQQNTQLSELNRKVMVLEATNEAIVTGITKPKVVYAPANLEGSAFALNNNGYLVTSFHMINGADSVFIQNKTLERTLTKVVLTNPLLDIAILKIINDSVNKNWQVPFSLTEKTGEVGEKVFTLGYPRKDIVYGEGSVSSLSGYSNDTTMYQVSIPVNPGNSGGPLLDDQGNIIGVIRGKITGAEATGFAIKSGDIIRSLHAAGADSIQTVNKKASLKAGKRTEQIKKINPYVFNVLVYKKD